MLYLHFVSVFWWVTIVFCHDSDSESIQIDNDRCCSPFIPFDLPLPHTEETSETPEEAPETPEVISDETSEQMSEETSIAGPSSHPNNSALLLKVPTPTLMIVPVSHPMIARVPDRPMIRALHLPLSTPIPSYVLHEQLCGLQWI